MSRKELLRAVLGLSLVAMSQGAARSGNRHLALLGGLEILFGTVYATPAAALVGGAGLLG